MTSKTLAQDYFKRVRSRFKALKLLLSEDNYADVIRESQELSELLLKGWLRSVGIEPPKWHDVGPILNENKMLLPQAIQLELDKVLDLSRYLRRERENSFYGEEDMVPLETFTKFEAEECVTRIEWLLNLFSEVMKDN